MIISNIKIVHAETCGVEKNDHLKNIYSKNIKSNKAIGRNFLVINKLKLERFLNDSINYCVNKCINEKINVSNACSSET